MVGTQGTMVSLLTTMRFRWTRSNWGAAVSNCRDCWWSGRLEGQRPNQLERNRDFPRQVLALRISYPSGFLVGVRASPGRNSAGAGAIDLPGKQSSIPTFIWRIKGRTK